MTLHYIGSFDRNAEANGVYQFPAAATKSAYIIDKIKESVFCEHLNLLSTAQLRGREWKVNHWKKTKYDKVETDYLIPSVSSPFRVIRALNVILVFLSILQYFFFYVKKGDTVMVYHSCAYLQALRIACRLKKFRLIMEVEELYGDVANNRRMKLAELNMMKFADAFMFPTVLLEDIANKERKPSLVITGLYTVTKDRQVSWGDDKKHCVYAGTFDPTKGGAAAAAAAAFLPADYHMHILGFGSAEQVKNIQSQINDVSKKCKCTLTYDGLKSGEEYIEFLQKCQIGLCTQIPDAKYAGTSFPSKVLVYMSNGLSVVSSRFEAIEKSDVGDLVYYYDEQTPKCIAKAIQSVKLSNKNSNRARLQELDVRFARELEWLLENIDEQRGK